MRDYDSMPKIDWQDDKSTLTKIKAQINLQEPIVICIPDDFKLTVNAKTCGCEIISSMLLRCQPQPLFSELAVSNMQPTLNDLGKLAHDRGQVVDIDQLKRIIVVYD